MAIARPQVIVHQEFSEIPPEITDPLRAHISGPNKDLHRFDNAEEKAFIKVGLYDNTVTTKYTFPGRDPGGIVDEDSLKVFFEEALLEYLNDPVGSASEILSTDFDRVRSDTLAFTDSEDGSIPRSAELLDRDVTVGDTVDLKAVVGSDVISQRTFVKGFAAEPIPAIVGNASNDPDNADDQTASTSIELVDGLENCVGATADGSSYDGLVDGDITETYQVEVTIGSAGSDATTARLRVTSASGNDDQAEVTPSAFGVATSIGTRGLAVTFDISGTGSSCSSEAFSVPASPNDLIKGQTWEVVVAQAFEAPISKSGGTYAGDEDDTYLVEVVEGGDFISATPKIKVTTAKGLDFSGPTFVPSHNTEVGIGSKGVTILFHGTGSASISSSVSQSGGEYDTSLVSFDPVAGLRKGDKYFVPVTAEKNGRVSTLILGHTILDDLQTAPDLDLTLYITKPELEIRKERIETPPVLNWEPDPAAEDNPELLTQICIHDGITAFDESYTSGGDPVALPVASGAEIFVEFAEFLPEWCNKVGSLRDVADIDLIPGPLDPGNPLKWGVFKALSNSNATAVKFTAVCNPDDVDEWINVLEVIKGRDDVYGLVPLTRDRTVWDLFQAHVNAQSAADIGFWRVAWFSPTVDQDQELVGINTSDDSELVLATLEDDPFSTGTQYTWLKVTSENINLLEAGIEPGDTVRYLYTSDGFGNEEFSEFTVDAVINADTIRLFTGHASAISVPSKVEIYHSLSKTEYATELVTIAQSFSDRRIRCTWPDIVGSSGEDTNGYYMSCALAGLRSGIVPHRSMTNLEIAGFDDVNRSDEFFTATQIDILRNGGVWVVTTDRDGTIITHLGETTDVSGLAQREEMVVSNVDSISFLIKNRLQIFIGQANVTPSALKLIQIELTSIIEFLKVNGYTEMLGGQLIDATIRAIRQHPLLKDRVTVILDLEIPFPINNIEVFLFV